MSRGAAQATAHTVYVLGTVKPCQSNSATLTTLQQWHVPDQLISSCDGSPKQIVVLHGEVDNASIKLGHIEERKEMGRVKHRGVGRKTGQSYIVVMRCDALSACALHTYVLSICSREAVQQMLLGLSWLVHESMVSV